MSFPEDECQEDRLNEPEYQSHSEKARPEMTNSSFVRGEAVFGDSSPNFSVVTAFVRPAPVQMNANCHQHHQDHGFAPIEKEGRGSRPTGPAHANHRDGV